MKQKYIIDTTALMSYFAEVFGIKSKISQDAINIIDDAFEGRKHLLLIPSIVFIEIFSKQFTSPERAAKIRYAVYEKIKSCENISIESIDQEVLENFILIKDIESDYNFDNHDKIIYATAIKHQSPMITSDLRLIRYNKKKKLIPNIMS